LQIRETLNPDDLAQRKKDLYTICDKIARARAHDEELEEYLQIVKIIKSAHNEKGSRKRYRNTVGFDSGDHAGITLGEDNNAHNQLMNTLHKFDKRMTIA
jgi:hypothetical protein